MSRSSPVTAGWVLNGLLRCEFEVLGGLAENRSKIDPNFWRSLPLVGGFGGWSVTEGGGCWALIGPGLAGLLASASGLRSMLALRCGAVLDQDGKYQLTLRGLIEGYKVYPDWTPSEWAKRAWSRRPSACAPASSTRSERPRGGLDDRLGRLLARSAALRADRDRQTEPTSRRAATRRAAPRPQSPAEVSASTGRWLFWVKPSSRRRSMYMVDPPYLPREPTDPPWAYLSTVPGQKGLCGSSGDSTSYV